jgi:ribosome-associated heat shock protein Hsp15
MLMRRNDTARARSQDRPQGAGQSRPDNTPTTDPEVRLDVWLDVACLFKTRSEAQKACRGGKVTVNGLSAKPNRPLRAGDALKVNRGHGRVQSLIVRIVTDTHLPKAEARALYEDTTPPPTAQEIEQRRMDRIYRAVMTPPRAPDKRERRALRRLQGKE